MSLGRYPGIAILSEARATGRSVAALIRDRVEVAQGHDAGSVYALTTDLAGCVTGGRKSATNDRRKFRRQ